MDVIKACQQSLGEEARDFEDALVYLDQGALEAFHFCGGLPLFLQLGVRAVCQLESAAASNETVAWNGATEPLSNIVILLSQLLSDAHRFVLRCFRAHPDVLRFTILSAVSQDAHSSCEDTPLGTDAFTEYKDLLRQDLAKQDETGNTASLSVSVKHLQLLCCSFTPKVFVLPSASAFASAPLSRKKEMSFLSTGLPAYDNGLAWDEDELLPSGATLHAHFLHHLAAQLDLKFDVFSLGPLAHVVGKHLNEISTLGDGFGRARKPAGLLLIDRSMDLITPTCHGDSMIDKIFVSHQQTSPHERPSMDMRIPSLEQEKFVDEDEDCDNISGSLSTAWDFQEVDKLDVLFEKRGKDGGLLIRKWVHEAFRQEKIDLPGKSRLAVTAGELRFLVSNLLGHPAASLKYNSLIQLGKAAAETFTTSQVSKWEAFASAERVLGITAVDGAESLASHVCDLIRQSTSQETSILSLRDALTVMIVAYALAGEYTVNKDVTQGPFSWHEERTLKNLITEAILKGPVEPPLGFLNGLQTALGAYWQRASEPSTADDDWSEEKWESWDDADETRQQELTTMQLKLELHDRIDELFNVLHKVAAARTHYPLTKSQLVTGAYRGVINEVLSLLLAKSEVPGLKHHSSKVSRFLKSGLGRFGLGQPKLKLYDHKSLVIFVIGGFNAVEVREARALKGDFDDLLIGGTTLLTPDAMYKLLLGSRNEVYMKMLSAQKLSLVQKSAECFLHHTSTAKWMQLSRSSMKMSSQAKFLVAAIAKKSQARTPDLVASIAVAESLPTDGNSWRLTDQHMVVLGVMASVIMGALCCIFLAAIPTLLAIKKAAESLEKLANTTREELPGTMAAVRLSGMEISDLTMELSDLGQEITAGVRRSTRAVRAAESGIRRFASAGTNRRTGAGQRSSPAADGGSKGETDATDASPSESNLQEPVDSEADV